MVGTIFSSILKSDTVYVIFVTLIFIGGVGYVAYLAYSLKKTWKGFKESRNKLNAIIDRIEIFLEDHQGIK